MIYFYGFIFYLRSPSDSSIKLFELIKAFPMWGGTWGIYKNESCFQLSKSKKEIDIEKTYLQ